MCDQAHRVFEELCNHSRQLAILGAIDALLGWDERTMMPPAAGEYRAEQIAFLAGLIHERFTDPKVGEWLHELQGVPESAEADMGVTVRRIQRRYDRATRLPKTLVEELARATVRGQQVWQEARRLNRFDLFQPALERIVQLKQEEAESLGYQDSPYDALLDGYEPEATTRQVAEVLGELAKGLVPLVKAIAQGRRKIDTAVLHGAFPVDVQERLGREAAAAIGFDFQRGRLDVTAHPFCSSMGPSDCRITTRYDEHYFNQAFFGILHEAGHGIYDQGLRADQYGLPLGEAASLAIHESQSRLWENLVGRSRSFWEFFYPRLQVAFPAALGNATLDQFYAAINEVRPSLVRVEADEITYNLHIALRFELERALLEGGLKVSELPQAWNAAYEKYLGVKPADDAEGVLQDVHWSAGLIGYFPTYALGNLAAAQFFKRADRDLGGLADPIRRGDFLPLRDWLRRSVHQMGQRYFSAELVERVTGEPLSPRPLLEYLRSKYGALYGLKLDG